MVDPHCFRLTFNLLRVAAVFNRQITNGGELTTEVWDAREMSPISSSGTLGNNHFSSARRVLAAGRADGRQCHQSAADGFWGLCVNS